MDRELLTNNISKLTQRVRLSVQNCQRAPDAVDILAVSKTRPAEDIRAAFDLGLTQFGENYLQEALEKIEQLADLPITWHFIGPIQSNKTRPIAEHFDWVHSVDRLKIARRLSEQRPAELPPLNICLQVNISRQASKSGATVEELPALVEQVRELPRLRLQGLMAIPAPSEDPAQQRAAFAALREAAASCASAAHPLPVLSMGMSGDLEAAIAEGATIVRVGTDIFGARQR